MVADLPNFRGDLKISDQNNWGGPEQKINKFGGGTKFKGGPRILGGPMNVVGKGAQPPPPFSRSTHPFLRFPSFLEIQDVPPFIGLSGKQKY